MLAGFEAKTSRAAVGRSLATGPANLSVLDADLMLGVFQQLLPRTGDAEVEHILEETRKVLRQDELNEALAPRLRQLAQEGPQLIMKQAPRTEPPPSAEAVLLERTLQAHGRTGVLEDLEGLLGRVRAELENADDNVSLQGTIRLLRKSDE